MLQPFGPGDDRRGLGLGAGIELLDHLAAQPVDEGLLEPGRARRSQVPEGLQRRQVVLGPRLLRQVPDPVHHGRHHIDPAGLPARDLGQGLFGIEPGHHHDVGAHVYGRHHHAEAGVVIERGRQQGDRLGPQLPAADLGDVFHRHAGLAGQDQLGPAGGAAAGGRLGDRRNDIRQVGLVVGLGGDVVDIHQRLVDRMVERRDDDGGLGQLHDRLELGLGQAEGHRLRRRAHLPQGPAGLDEADAVGQAQGDEIPVLDPQRHQAAGQAVGPPVELVIGQGFIATGDRRGVGLFPRQVSQARAQGNRLVGHGSSSLMQGRGSLRRPRSL